MRLSGSDEIPRLDVSTEELEALVEQARAVLPEDGYQKLLGAVHTLRYVTELLEKKDNVVASRIPDREAILGSIKEFLSTGK